MTKQCPPFALCLSKGRERSSRLLRRRGRHASLPILWGGRRLAVRLRVRLSFRPAPVLVGVRLAGAVPHPGALLHPARHGLPRRRGSGRRRPPGARTPPLARRLHGALCLSDALRASGGADDPACHWLYDTLLSADPDLRLAALAFLPLLAALYLRRLPPELPSSLSGSEAVLLAVYSSEAKNRQGKPVLVQVPDLAVPSLYHTPASSPSCKSPRRSQPPPIPPPQATPVVGVLSPPLEPQAAVKSTKRAGIIGIAFEAYYSKISQMPAASKVDACNAAAAWAGQCCKCRFELDGKELEEEEADSFGSVSPMSSEAENGKELEDELARMRINGDSGGRNCSEEDKEARVPLPWELLQPVVRVLGHCLLAPLNPGEVRDAAAEAVRVVYARACHDLLPQAILAARSLIELDKSAQRWRLLGKLLQLALLEAMRQALGQVQSQTHQASSGSLTHYSCPNKIAATERDFTIPGHGSPPNLFARTGRTHFLLPSFVHINWI